MKLYKFGLSIALAFWIIGIFGLIIGLELIGNIQLLWTVLGTIVIIIILALSLVNVFRAWDRTDKFSFPLSYIAIFLSLPTIVCPILLIIGLIKFKTELTEHNNQINEMDENARRKLTKSFAFKNIKDEKIVTPFK